MRPVGFTCGQADRLITTQALSELENLAPTQRAGKGITIEIGASFLSIESPERANLTLTPEDAPRTMALIEHVTHLLEGPPEADRNCLNVIARRYSPGSRLGPHTDRSPLFGE